MFDFSLGEMLVVALVALVVLGPERLPKAARFAGLWVRRARAQWYSVKSELERDLAAEELRKISLRLDRVVAGGRDGFVDGSATFDHATVAIIRLAALFEDSARFGEFLAAATDDERRGISHTRNIAAHVGYASMDADIFWRSMTVDAVAFVAKIRDANGL